MQLNLEIVRKTWFQLDLQGHGVPQHFVHICGVYQPPELKQQLLDFTVGHRQDAADLPSAVCWVVGCFRWPLLVHLLSNQSVEIVFKQSKLAQQCLLRQGAVVQQLSHSRVAKDASLGVSQEP